MALMWPRTMPAHVLVEPHRSTEVKVYHNLEQELDDTFTVFYSRPWLGKKDTGEEIDGECDFVVAHPDLGMLTLEVKGGVVSYDPATDRWRSRDRGGFNHIIKPPVKQAKDSKYHLFDKLNRSPVWQSRRIPAAHGVIFPDVERPDRDFGPDMPLEIFCFLDDFRFGLRDWILSRFDAAGRGYYDPRSLGEDGMAALEDLLARPILTHVPLGAMLSSDEQALATLTEEQFHILRAIEDVPRVAIPGGAGTGKTVLAMEEALRRQEADARVLLTCYNRPLAEDMRRRMGDLPGLTVTSFHEFCYRCARRARIPLPDGDSADNRVYKEDYPRALIEALRQLPSPRFDCIIIDEGQDFQPLWFDALFASLENPDCGIVRVFHDSNQRIYGERTFIPASLKPVSIRLTRNLRNTRRIHTIVQQHYSGIPTEAIGPEGVPTEWIVAGDLEGMRRIIGERTRDLIEQERIGPDNIAVLVADRRFIPAIALVGRVGGHRVKQCDREPDDQSVTVDSVRRFKGLESPVVILALTPEFSANEELLYVAISRARTHLIVVGLEESLRMAGHEVSGKKKDEETTAQGYHRSQ